MSRDVGFAPLRLGTGVASSEAHEPPYPERFEVSAAAAVRALESAAGRRPGGRTWWSHRGAGCASWTGC